MDNNYRACSKCNEYRKPALRKKESNLCHNCADKTHRHGQCWICHIDDLPIEEHHIAGKKHAKRTIPICLNCHAMLSRRQYQWPDLWRGDPCAGFLLIGFMDYCALYSDPTMPLDVLGEKSQLMTRQAFLASVDVLIFLVKFMPLVIVLMLVLRMAQTSA